VRAREILKLLNTLDEHHAIEAKKGSDVERSFLETVCAFANEPNLGGGWILLGVEREEDALFPAYEVTGVAHPDEVSQKIATQCASVFNQPVRPKVRTETLNGRPVIVVHVPESSPGDKPVYFKTQGLPRGAYRRIGSTDQHCGEDDLFILYSQRSSETPDRAIVADATLADLDPAAIEQYRKARGRVNPAAEELQWDDEELLTALNAVRSEHGFLKPTVTGLLLFGTRQALRRLFPMTRVDYIRVPGNAWVADPDNRFSTVDMRGPLLSLVQRAQDAVVDDLPKGFILAEGQTQAETPQLSSRVLREAIVNAIMHRSYQVQSPTQIIRYNNRIEIINPGYSLKAEERLGEPGSETRNPHIAAVFHETNLAETKGSGIRTMRRLMDEAGFAPPTFESDRTGNRFVTRLLLHHFLNPDDLRWLAGFDDLALTDAQRRALVFLREAGALDNATCRQINGTDTLTASQDLRRLRQAGLVEKKGQGSTTYYVPGPRFLASSGQETAEGTGAISGGGGAISMGTGAINTGTGAQIGNVHQLTGAQIENVHQLPESLRSRLPSPGQYLKSLEMKRIILDLCDWRPFQISELSTLLNRSDKYLLRKHLRPMLQTGELEYTFPEMINHPRQAYRIARRKDGGDR
jgi:ATP-dependent DNA helicase RecG